MSIFNQFKTSKSAEQEGILIRFKANDDGTFPTFRIARTSRYNTRWVKTFEAKTRPFKKEIDNDTIDEAVARKLNIEVFCESILLGWDNVQNDNEENIPFNFENAVELMNQLPELYLTLERNSKNMDNFLESNLKEEEKNF